MKKMISIFLFTLLFSFTASAMEQVVVLVPGFFSRPQASHGPLPASFPDYILAALSRAGWRPVVIRDLNPVGSLVENGARLERDLREIVREHPAARFALIAHSAGGLYAAKALTSSPDLPIDHVITIGTPYAGAELVDLLKSVPGIDPLVGALNLQNLREFEATAMPAVLATLHIPKSVRWTALAAAQPVCRWLTCANADHLSWLLSLVWRYSGVEGDGVVSVASARAEGTGLNFETWGDFVVPLEHWEVTLNSNLFVALGITNPSWIRETQTAVFSQIAAGL